jgi:hypothetical protein
MVQTESLLSSPLRKQGPRGNRASLFLGTRFRGYDGREVQDEKIMLQRPQ